MEIPRVELLLLFFWVPLWGQSLFLCAWHCVLHMHLSRLFRELKRVSCGAESKISGNGQRERNSTRLFCLLSIMCEACEVCEACVR